MDERLLVKASLACSIIGIVALFFLSESIEIGESAINKIDIGMIGNDVSVSGRVSRITNSEKVSIISINDENNEGSEITVVAFKKNSDDIKLNNNDNIRVIGKIDEYNGRPEIIASEIKVIAD